MNNCKWEKIYEYSEHKNSVNCVSFANHEFGLILLAGSSDGNISIHEYKSTFYLMLNLAIYLILKVYKNIIYKVSIFIRWKIYPF